MFLFLAALSMEKIYLGCGLFGAALFAIRTVLMLMGADASDVDMDVDISHGDVGDLSDGGHGAGDAGHHEAGFDVDADAGLKILTLQGIMAFVMMFGLTGYALSTNGVMGDVLVVVVSVAVGVFAMWLVAKLFLLMNRLQSSGTTSLDAAVGEEGTIYLTIPAEGTGKIQVKVGHHLKVVDAVSETKEEIKTGERASVSYTMDGRTLVVRKV